MSISSEASETHFRGITEEKRCCGEASVEAGCQLGSELGMKRCCLGPTEGQRMLTEEDMFPPV